MKVKGIAMWACVNHIDTKFNQYKIDLIVTKAEAAKLKEAGIKVKKVVDEEDDTITLQCRFTRNELNKKTGNKNPKPQCVDAACKVFDGDIGNGSEVIVRFKPYTWSFNGAKGTSGDLQGVQILTLVEYERPEGEEGEEDGFQPMGESMEGNDDNFEQEEPTPPPPKKKAPKKQQEELEY